MWQVDYTDQFGAWYAATQCRGPGCLVGRVELLEEHGPGLGRPTVDNVYQFKHANWNRSYDQFAPAP